MNDTSILIAEKISYKINEIRLFHNLNFSLKEGSALHICGENGSGKSTLIRIILGLTQQTKGTIKHCTKNKISYLGHKNALKSYLTLEENLLLMQLNNMKELNRYVEILDLKKFLDVRVANLSFGQQKKLALLRVFLNNSNLLILDEPFVGLDKSAQNLLSSFLNKELSQKKGLIYTSHIECDLNSEILNLNSN